MIKVQVIQQDFKVKASAFNVVTSCDPATVTATNSDSTVVGTTTVPSGGTGNIPIANSVISNTQGVLNNLPATTPLTITDSVVTLNNTAGLLSTNNVPATTNLTLTAPNSTTNVTDQNGTPLGQVTGISGATNTQSVTVPPCPTLDELVDTSTNQQVFDAIDLANKDCPIQRLLLDRYKVNGFASVGSFGTATGSNPMCTVYNGLIYMARGTNNIQIYDALTFSLLTTVTGFTFGFYLDFSPDGTQYAVVNLSANSVRIMDTATNTQVTSFAVLASPRTVCWNNLGTELYVCTLSATTITRYDLSGNTLGTVGGFDGRIQGIIRVGANYHVLNSNGTTAGSTQRVRVMDFATNTQQSTHSLGTVATIGPVVSLQVANNRAWVISNSSVSFNGVLFISEYDNAYNLLRNDSLQLRSDNLNGFGYNPAYCGSLIVPVSLVNAGITVLL